MSNQKAKFAQPVIKFPKRPKENINVWQHFEIWTGATTHPPYIGTRAVMESNITGLQCIWFSICHSFWKNSGRTVSVFMTLLHVIIQLESFKESFVRKLNVSETRHFKEPVLSGSEERFPPLLLTHFKRAVDTLIMITFHYNAKIFNV